MVASLDERASVAATGSQPTPNGTHAAAAATGATFRQIDYWVRKGLLGEEPKGRGPGSRRTFTSRDLEVIHALVRLASLGAVDGWLASAADAMRAGPVHPKGERLVVLLDGSCLRSRLDSPSTVAGPGWVVPLRSFADQFEDGRGSTKAPSPPAAVAGDRGRHPGTSIPGRPRHGSAA